MLSFARTPWGGEACRAHGEFRQRAASAVRRSREGRPPPRAATRCVATRHAVHPCPVATRALTAASSCLPEPLGAEGRHRVGVSRHGVGGEVPSRHACQPAPLLRYRSMHMSPKLLVDLGLWIRWHGADEDLCSCGTPNCPHRPGRNAGTTGRDRGCTRWIQVDVGLSIRWLGRSRDPAPRPRSPRHAPYRQASRCVEPPGRTAGTTSHGSPA